MNNAYGESSNKVYSDVDGIDEVRGLIGKYASSRLVDNFILNLSKSSSGPKTAAVFPPLIYGRGRGPVNQRSVQVPELAKATLQRRGAIQVGKGQSIWSNVYITDISQIFVQLVEKAVQGEEGDFWNENGLYFAENGGLVRTLDFLRIYLHVANTYTTDLPPNFPVHRPRSTQTRPCRHPLSG